MRLIVVTHFQKHVILSAAFCHSERSEESVNQKENSGYNGKKITYDAIGNPLNYMGKAMTWEKGRRLKSINENGLNIAYSYGLNGIRTEKTVNGKTTKYLLNGDMIIGEMRDSESVLYYYDAEGKAVGYGIKKNAETAYTNYYLLRNAQNDILEIYDSKSVKVGSYTYDTWGKPVAITPSQGYANAESILKANPFRYRGYYYDEETKLYYLNSRYYDPEVGRFINADTVVAEVGSLQGSNLYSYCFNNPVNMEDSSWPTLSQIFTVVAVVAAVATVVAVSVATAGVASLALAGGGILTSGTATALGVAYTAGKVSVAALGAAAVSDAYDKLPRNHTVYGLIDTNTKQIEYVGRTTNPVNRAKAHEKNPARAHLEMVTLATGLNAIEARGLEQIKMLEHHTINTANSMYNQINGISPFNPKLGIYMAAGRGVAAYWGNRISNEILYWTGN